jgi:hypothetical protein
MAGTSPTARTLAECRRRGWPAQVVEQTIPRTFIKRDLFGFIDIVALTPDGLLGIQATSGTNHAARITKARQQPHFAAWLRSGARFAVWSWSRRGDRGKRKLWTLREESVHVVC